MKPFAATPFLILEMLSMPHTVLASENLASSTQTSPEDRATATSQLLGHFNSFLDHNLSIRRSKDSKLTDPLLDLRKQVEASATNSSQESPTQNEQSEARSLAATKKANAATKLAFKHVSRDSSWNNLAAHPTDQCNVRTDADANDFIQIPCPVDFGANPTATSLPVTIGQVGRLTYFKTNAKQAASPPTQAEGFASSTARYSTSFTKANGTKVTLNFWCYGGSVARYDFNTAVTDADAAAGKQRGWLGCAACDLGQYFSTVVADSNVNWPYKECKDCDAAVKAEAYSCQSSDKKSVKWCLGQSDQVGGALPATPTRWYYSLKDAADPNLSYRRCTADCKTIADWKDGANQLGGYSTRKGADDASGDYIKYTADMTNNRYTNKTYVGDPWCAKCTAKCTDCTNAGDDTKCDVGKCWANHFQDGATKTCHVDLACVAGKYQVKDTCVDCPDGCATCEFNGAVAGATFKCTACKDYHKDIADPAQDDTTCGICVEGAETPQMGPAICACKGAKWQNKPNASPKQCELAPCPTGCFPLLCDDDRTVCNDGKLASSVYGGGTFGKCADGYYYSVDQLCYPILNCPSDQFQFQGNCIACKDKCASCKVLDPLQRADHHNYDYSIDFDGFAFKNFFDQYEGKPTCKACITNAEWKKEYGVETNDCKCQSRTFDDAVCNQCPNGCTECAHRSENIMGPGPDPNIPIVVGQRTWDECEQQCLDGYYYSKDKLCYPVKDCKIYEYQYQNDCYPCGELCGNCKQGRNNADVDSKGSDTVVAQCISCIAGADRVYINNSANPPVKNVWKDRGECMCHSYKRSTNSAGDKSYGKIDATGDAAKWGAKTCDLCPYGCLECSDDKSKCFYPCDQPILASEPDSANSYVSNNYYYSGDQFCYKDLFCRDGAQYQFKNKCYDCPSLSTKCVTFVKPGANVNTDLFVSETACYDNTNDDNLDARVRQRSPAEADYQTKAISGFKKAGGGDGGVQKNAAGDAIYPVQKFCQCQFSQWNDIIQVNDLPPGSTRNSPQGSCQYCGWGCLQCTDDTKCNACMIAGDGKTNQLTLQDGQCKCPPATFKDNGQDNRNAPTCTNCSPNCQVCTGSDWCTTCTQGYYVKTDQCTRQDCGWKQYQAYDWWWDEWYTENYWDCWDVQYDCKKYCLKCPTSLTNCLTCSDPNTCTKCQAGTYLDTSTGKCVACVSSCSTCTGPNQCTSCPQGFWLQGNTCQPCANGCQACTDGSTCTKTKGGWWNNNGVVTQCLSDCATCSNGVSCDTCPLTVVPATKNSKKRCPPNCNQPGTYRDEDNLVCQSCPSNCPTCQFNAAKTPKVQCNSVSKGFFLSAAGNTATACSANFDSCTSATAGVCKAGFFYDVNKCTACRADCATCSSGTACDSCRKDGSSLTKDKTCLPNCAGKPQTFPDYVSYTCKACSSNCNLCLSDTVCQTCNPVGFFLDATKACSACNAMCLTCNNAATCLTCKAGSVLRGGDCIPICNTPATYPDKPSQTCKNCLTNCNACTNGADCQQCKNGFYWDSAACSGCPAGCATCQNANFCLTCTGGVVPQRGLCPSTGYCGSGKYLNYSNNKCENCVSGCDSCTNANTCVKCLTGKTLDATTKLCK